jgi:hypothetical protein
MLHALSVFQIHIASKMKRFCVQEDFRLFQQCLKNHVCRV